MKKMSQLVLCLLLFSMVPLSVLAADSPDAAAHAFVDAIAANEFAKAIACFSGAERAQQADWRAQAERIRAYIPHSQDLMAPTEYPAFAALNQAVMEGRTATQIYAFCTSFFSLVGVDGQAVSPIDTEWIEDYAASIDPSALGALRLEALYDLPQELMTRAAANMILQARVQGAEEQVEKLALYRLGDRAFLGGMCFLRFGEEWKLYRLTSTLLGTNAFGTVTEVPLDQLEEAIAGVLGE